MTAKEAAKAEARAKLREWLKPGDTVYTILRHVSRSGMSRDIGVVLLHPDQRPNRPLVDLHPNWLVAEATGFRMKSGPVDGVTVGGCGMDMGFHLIYSLSASLFPDGFGCIGEGCPSNDHSNGDRDYTPHCHPHIPCVDQIRGGPGTIKDGCHKDHWHKDGGYALRQRWL